MRSDPSILFLILVQHGSLGDSVSPSLSPRTITREVDPQFSGGQYFWATSYVAVLLVSDRTAISRLVEHYV